MSANAGASPPTTRKARKAATRAALKAALRSCLLERGWMATGVGDVARAAGVAHGTFYVHFPSKEAAIEELLVEFNEGLAERLAPLLASARDRPLGDLVREAAELFLDYWLAHRSFVEAYAIRSGTGLDLASVRDGVNPPVLRLLRVALEGAAATRGSPAARWDLVAQGLLALWLRIGMQYLFGDAVTREEALETLVCTTTGAIAAVLGGGSDG